MAERRSVKDKIKGMTLCGRLSAATTALALAAALGVAAWTGEAAGLKLAAAIVLFAGVSAGLEYFSPTTTGSNSLGEAD